jgi:AraC-like DNA-binding protein
MATWSISCIWIIEVADRLLGYGTGSNADEQWRTGNSVRITALQKQRLKIGWTLERRQGENGDPAETLCEGRYGDGDGIGMGGGLPPLPTDARREEGWVRGDATLLRYAVLRTGELADARDTVSKVFTPHRIEVLEDVRHLDVRLNAVRLGGLTAGYLHYGAHVRMVNHEAMDAYFINIPLAGRTESWTGVDSVISTPQQAAVFLPGRPAGIRWERECAQLCVKFTKDSLESEFEELVGHRPSRPVTFAASLDLTSAASQSWLSVLALLRRECARPAGIAQQPLAARHLEHLLICGFLLAQPHDYSAALADPPAPVAPRAVRAAIELMEAHPERPLTVTDIARTVGVGVRALQNGFRQHLGLSPMSYLRDVRLGRVHAELSASSADVTVAEAALRWGFVHLGRFGVAYRKKFGVPPSRTLRAARGPYHE